MSERVGGFEGAENSLLLRQRAEGGERLGIGGTDIFGPPAVLEVRMLGADRGIIEARRDRPALGDLAILVLEDIGLGAVEDAWAAAQQGRTMLGTVEALARGLNPDQPDRSVKKVGEQADRVGFTGSPAARRRATTSSR